MTVDSGPYMKHQRDLKRVEEHFLSFDLSHNQSWWITTVNHWRDQELCRRLRLVT